MTDGCLYCRRRDQVLGTTGGAPLRPRAFGGRRNYCAENNAARRIQLNVVHTSWPVEIVRPD